MRPAQPSPRLGTCSCEVMLPLSLTPTICTMEDTRPRPQSVSRWAGLREKASAMRVSARHALSTIFASCTGRAAAGNAMAAMQVSVQWAA